MTSRETELVSRLRSICLGLPEVHEQQAWVGTRWRVRTKTFAHILTIEHGWPPAYARAAATDGPITVLMFRSSGDELDVLRSSSAPFFAPPWRVDEVGVVLGRDTDWTEIAELITDSYCAVAPQTLARTVPRPE
ncbi:MAG: MmcQ/YjbR family DNA-binding protein [Actinobacteria bacterium]|nr:MmcQ/YjbR family DNA-binding protein [Actinomycetota bacterium]